MSSWHEVARLVAEGDMDSAERTLAVARRHEPDPPREALVRARIAWGRGHRQVAVALLKKAGRDDLVERWTHPEPEETALIRHRQERSPGTRPLPDPAEQEASVEWQLAPLEKQKKVRASFEEHQIDLLLGGSAFLPDSSGPATDLIAVPRRGLSSWTKRSIVLLVVGLLAVGGHRIVELGLARKASGRAQALAQDLRQLLRIGSYAHASAVVEQLTSQARDAGTLAAHADLLALGHGLIWRFHDRDVSRIMRAEELLRSPHPVPSQERLLAQALLIIDQHPREAVEALRHAIEIQRDDVNASLLLGIAASKNGERLLAARAFRRAEELEPPHLASLYAQLEHWVGAGDKREAAELLARMNDVSPTSPWTALGRALTGEGTRADLAMLAEADDAPEAVRARAKELLDR